MAGQAPRFARSGSLRDYVKPAIYTKEQILAYSNGKPSEGFGEPYRIFDSGRKIARLPGPPFQFMDRVTAVRGEPWQMAAGAMAEAQYDILGTPGFLPSNASRACLSAVLLEAALQPCGWLAAYVGSALHARPTSPSATWAEAVQHRPVTRKAAPSPHRDHEKGGHQRRHDHPGVRLHRG